MLSGQWDQCEQEMRRWTLEDIPWDRFDPTRVDEVTVSVVKAASLVERNAGDYSTYLCRVFADDADFQRHALEWAEEEAQHGEALGRWAELADPGFDFRDSFNSFVRGYQLPLDAQKSVRGSRSGELIARCIVESGTSSLYSALRDSSDEPVLKIICHRIAGDEFRHYKLFYTYLQRYLAEERPWLLQRILVAFQRCRETEDDELAFAYHCANYPGQTYNRKLAADAYFHRAFGKFRREHFDRAVSMMTRAGGLSPKGSLAGLISEIAWRYIQAQVQQRGAA